MPRIVIVPEGKGCRVVPAHVHVQGGEAVSWLNLTGDDITIWFPNSDQVFDALPAPPPGPPPPPPPDIAKGAVIAHGAPHDRNVKAGPHGPPGAGGLVTGQHPYAIFCKLTNTFAEGDSPPAIDVP